MLEVARSYINKSNTSGGADIAPSSPPVAQENS